MIAGLNPMNLQIFMIVQAIDRASRNIIAPSYLMCPGRVYKIWLISSIRAICPDLMCRTSPKRSRNVQIASKPGGKSPHTPWRRSPPLWQLYYESRQFLVRPEALSRHNGWFTYTHDESFHKDLCYQCPWW